VKYKWKLKQCKAIVFHTQTLFQKDAES